MTPTKTQKIALSTCWSSHRHQDGYQMLCEMADLGYSFVELSHGIPITLLPGIYKAINENIIQVSSVHNFCPLPPGVFSAAPNYFQPSHPNPREQQLWKIYTDKTLQVAQQLHAPFVVTHSGSIPFWLFHPTNKLLKSKAGLSSSQYKRIQKKASRYQSYTNESFSEILPTCQDRLITLAIENREAPHELPLDHDIPTMLDQLPGTVYWHDTGHAHIKETLGIIDQQQLLQDNKHRIGGFHIKDANNNLQDNFAIGQGNIDFQLIFNFIEPHHVLVVEMGNQVTKEEIIYAREYLEHEVTARQHTCLGV